MNYIKPLILACGLSVIVSCGWMTPPPFDTTEYALLVELETHARFLETECANSNYAEMRLNDMLFIAEQLNTYTYYLPDNEELYEATLVVVEDVEQMSEKYTATETPSVGYCQMKTKIILANVHTILETLGKLKEN